MIMQSNFLGSSLGSKPRDSVFNFSVYFSLIVTENSREKIADKCIEKLKMPLGKFCKRLVKFGLYNPLPCTFSSQVINFSELVFNKNYLTLDPNTNTASSLRFAYLSKWQSKP